MTNGRTRFLALLLSLSLALLPCFSALAEGDNPDPETTTEVELQVTDAVEPAETIAQENEEAAEPASDVEPEEEEESDGDGAADITDDNADDSTGGSDATDESSIDSNDATDDSAGDNNTGNSDATDDDTGDNNTGSTGDNNISSDDVTGDNTGDDNTGSDDSSTANSNADSGDATTNNIDGSNAGNDGRDNTSDNTADDNDDAGDSENKAIDNNSNDDSTDAQNVPDEANTEDESAKASPLAEIKKNGTIYQDQNTKIVAAELAEEAIILVLEEKDSVSRIRYVLLSENKTTEVAEGYVKNDDLSILTVAQADAWQAKSHSVKKDIQGYSLEPITIIVKESAEKIEPESAIAQVEEAEAESTVLVSRAAPTEDAAPAAEASAIDTNTDVGTAAASYVAPAGQTTTDGEASDVLGNSEWNFLADVLAVEGASTEFAVDANGTLIQYNGTSTVVQIPLTVRRGSAAIPVTGIDDSAFAGNTTVTQIIVPTSVVWIDTGAFKGCTALQSINLPDNVTYISAEAFSGCTSLRSISWSDSVHTIMDRAFYGCSALQTLGSSSNVDEIGDYAFYGCSSLTAITWSNQLEKIGKYAYANCTGLSGLSFPASLQTVDDYAFTGCSNIQKVDFQGNTTLTTISTGAFKDCTALKSIYIPNSVSYLGNSAFENCRSATVLSLPTSLTIIQDFTFKNCTSLTSLYIPSNVVDIHREAFYGCSSVEYVYTIPSSVSFIGNYAFYGLRSDCTIVIENSSAVIGIDALGTSGTVFGWRNSTAQSYAGSHADVNFYDIRIVYFVQRCYTLIQNRTGEPSGVIYWSNKLATKENNGGDIVHGFIFSPEFTNRHLSNSQVVQILYLAMQGRTYDAPGLAYWKNFLDLGCSYDYVISGFCNSTEFHGICDSYGIDAGVLPLTQNRDQNVQVTAFVQRCYTIVLGRDGAEADGLNYWTGKLLNHEMSGGKVVSGFITSTEFKNRGLSVDDQLTILYKTMMDREPDADGLAYYKRYLAQNMSLEYVLQQFSVSVEFRFICANYGIIPGPVVPVEYRDWNAPITIYVNRLYKWALQRDPDIAGLNGMTGRILTKASSPVEVARDMFTSLESQLRWYDNADFVDAVYHGMLNRAPSSAELSAGIATLNTMTRADYIVHVGNSNEFKAIVAGFGVETK